MKCSRVISAAAQGLVSRSHHAYWHDVNPIKRQSLTPDEKAAARHKANVLSSQSAKRQAEIKRRFPNSKIIFV